MTKYTTRKDESYNQVLLRNGVDCICPFQSPLAVPVQTALGQMSVNIVRLPCATVCPFAEIVSDWDDITKSFELTYITHCTGTNVEFELLKPEEPEQPEQNNIFKI